MIAKTFEEFKALNENAMSDKDAAMIDGSTLAQDVKDAIKKEMAKGPASKFSEDDLRSIAHLSANKLKLRDRALDTYRNLLRKYKIEETGSKITSKTISAYIKLIKTMPYDRGITGYPGAQVFGDVIKYLSFYLPSEVEGNGILQNVYNDIRGIEFTNASNMKYEKTLIQYMKIFLGQLIDGEFQNDASALATLKTYEEKSRKADPRGLKKPLGEDPSWK